MTRGVVVVYFSRFGKPLQWHHKVVLEAGAKAIAAINGYEFGGQNERPPDRFDRLFFSSRLTTPCSWTRHHTLGFALRVRGIMLPGYTVIRNRDARVAARRILRRGPFRVKNRSAPREKIRRWFRP